MIVLAVLLLLAVALVVLFVVVTGITPTVQLEWSQISASVTLTALAVFLLGAACLLVAEAGLALLLRGNRKSWERRRELKRLRRVEAERARHAGPSGAPAGAPAGRADSPAATGTTTGADAPAAAAPGSGSPDGARGGSSRS
ncbi:hypothetical protein FHN55_08390 [Streptomyces sp. NP160]|uniref:hypothetical protein n=1 Tax=Streptomyces sp. NP160 TaxID=2586637 RepID=UPI001118295A|nr:hypothetical protein [Streptomyces sp. NP160]TNM68034.1 hypothetical protein FHN55_08390 [Streptomyces sp. NP160]